MLRVFARREFVDRVWGTEALDLAARFWLQAHDEADHPPHKSWDAHQILELHLTGFARAAVDAVSSELPKRFPTEHVTVSALDPDTRVAKVGPREGTRRPVPGLGVSALAGAPFDGLVVEIRYTVADAGATEPTPGLVGATLVIVGELRNGSVLVKLVWADPAFRPGADTSRVPGAGERSLPAALEHFRRRDTVDRWVRELFAPSPRRPLGQRLAARWQWLVDVPFERPRGAALVRRLAAAVLIPFLAAVMFIVGDEFEQPGWFLPPFVMLVPWACFTFAFMRLEYQRLFTLYPQYRAWYKWRFSVVERAAVLSFEGARQWTINPAVRKLSADLDAAGFVRVGDFSTFSEAVSTGVTRAYYAPDGHTYVLLYFHFETEPGPDQMQLWPAAVGTVCRTYLSAGTRCDTSSVESYLGRLGRKEPAVRRQVLPTTTHAVEVFEAHAKLIGACMVESDESTLALEPLEDYLVRHAAVAEGRNALYLKRPYSWRDHLRWYLQLDAKPAASK